MGRLSVVVNTRNQPFEWDMKKVPCQLEERGSKSAGIILMGFATLWSGIPVFSLITSFILGRVEPDGEQVGAALLFLVVGIGLFLLGLNEYCRHTVTKFDGKTLRYRHKPLFGSKAWDEPLSEYKGVTAKSHIAGGAWGTGGYTLYSVELLHPDKLRRIKLWQSRSSSDQHASLKKYSRQLGLPILKKDKASWEKLLRHISR